MEKCVKCKINQTKYTKKCGMCLEKELIFTITDSKIIATNLYMFKNGKIL
ncbi:MAG: hypothetical protein EHV01_005920 [Spiroplasma sp. hy2]